MSEAQRRQDLADFLRTRRMRLAPEEVGIISSGRRRTPGLRREEVAHLANVGVSWYTFLEQGRAMHPSTEVLHSIADALRLTSDERKHLFLLADQQYFPNTFFAPEEVSPALKRVLDVLDPVPAYVVGHSWNYLAWNSAAEHVFSLLEGGEPPYEYNVVWRIFARPTSHYIYKPTWEQVAQKVLAEFRADSARYADEEWFKDLVADLLRVSPEFRLWWPRHDVRGRADTQKDMMHPLVGILQFEHTTLQVPDAPELKVMIYTPLPETDTLTKIRRLMDMKVAARAM